MATILVRYGETGLKGPPVRRRFEDLLVENILRSHKEAKTSCVIERQRGRFFVNSGDQEASMEILSRTFGVVSASKAEESTSEVPEISRLAVESVRRSLPTGGKIAVRARRVGTHDYTSMQLAATVGEKVIDAFEKGSINVDLEAPDLEIFIEVRNNRSFVFVDKVQGPGGLPLRSQGRVLSIIEDRKSLLASWLMMRRGCSVILLNKSKLADQEIEALRPWNPWWGGILPDGDVEGIISVRRCSGLALGWTLDEFGKREAPSPGVPVFYPLIGMLQTEIDARMRSISV